MKKKMMVLLTTSAMLLNAVTASAAIAFSDINNVPWEGAKTYIRNVADLGLMVGEPDGNGTNIFRAKDNVTHVEAIQLTYNLLKEADEIVPSEAVTKKWQKIMDGYKIPSWACEAVGYSLEKKIITTDDLRYFMVDGKSKDATRQDVAEIFGKGLAEVYDVNEKPLLTFNDSAKIAEDAAPYVELLSNLNILVGDNNKNFNPAKDINRAEMAVMVSKTHDVLSGTVLPGASSKIAGTISSIYVATDKTKTITVIGENGNTYQFKGSNITPVSYNGTAVEFMDLTAGDGVTVEYVGKDIVNIILTHDAYDVYADFTVGTINYMGENSVTVNLPEGGIKQFKTLRSTVITFNGEVVDYRTITDVVDKGVDVNVTVTLLNEDYAFSVAATGEVGVVEGRLLAVDREGIKMKYHGGDKADYEFAKDMTIKYEGQKIEIEDLMIHFQNDEDLFLKAKIDEKDRISALEVTVDTEGGKVWGVVKGVSEDKVNVYSGSTYVSYYFEEKATITLDGRKSSLEELDAIHERGTDFTITLFLNSKGNVVSAEAELQDKTAGKITKLTEEYIEIKTEYGKNYKFYLDENAIVKFSGKTNETVKDLIAVYDKGTTEVKLDFTEGDLVTRIIAYVDWEEFSTTRGEIEGAETNSITIKNETYDMDAETTVVVDGKQIVSYDLYDLYRNGVVMDVYATIVDGYAEKLEVETIGAKGYMENFTHNKIAVKGALKSKDYKLADTVVIKIDKEKATGNIDDLFDRWKHGGKDYYVEVKIFEGEVVRIDAETIR
ncbi:MAG: S-layer homology domain-containing protein [Firmicutes bacterium]|nr:S-layer homology domain-containing protein [Bacillota bacterium]